MADARRLSKDRWQALCAHIQGLQMDLTEKFEPEEVTVDTPIEAGGFIFLRGTYRAA